MSCDNIFVPSIQKGDFRPRKILRSILDSADEELQWGANLELANNNNVNSSSEEQGLSLLTLLLECAVAISVDNLGEAHRMLLELTQMASPYAPSCAERVVAYFSKALSSRVINSWLGICSPLINYKSAHFSFQAFNNVSPFIKFAHFTSNQAILEAFHRRNRVHVVDLDIMQGLQWPALFHILATRTKGLRISGWAVRWRLWWRRGNSCPILLNVWDCRSNSTRSRRNLEKSSTSMQWYKFGGARH